jgi:glutathionylspermidine synthase
MSAVEFGALSSNFSLSEEVPPLRAGACLSREDFTRIRRELQLKFCKWDPQVGDVATLAPFPLLVTRKRWSELEQLAEQLTGELRAAEEELVERDDLYRTLAIPRPLRRVLRKAGALSPAAVRVMRFDFHWTSDGWRISEVNADVPGGFSEASEFPRLMSRRFDGVTPVGDPARAWAHSVATAGGPVALLVAAGFMEDHQVVSYLARVLRERGIEGWLANPQQLRWQSGQAHLDGQVLGAIIRFYQAEWLARLPRRSGWPQLMVGGRTPVSNPASCLFGESKRFPLIWDRLRTSLPTWRRLLPETRDPRAVPWRTDESWLLKTSWCNTGDTVTIRGLCPPKQWRHAQWSATFWPGHWIAQRRFTPIPVACPDGLVYPCIGVYTVDGKACGAYSRISTGSVIDYRAVDAALLLEGTE